MTSHTFHVQQIHCDGCEGAIRRAVGQLEGVSEVRPDHTSNQVEVRYDDQRILAETIAERLDFAGYPVVS